MRTSIIIPHCVMEDTTNLRNCLRTLAIQTVKPHQVIIMDVSNDTMQLTGGWSDWANVGLLCKQFDVELIHLPFRYHLPNWAEMFNTAFKKVTGDAIMLLCANWLLARYALEAMQLGLEQAGPGHIVVSDSQRQQMSSALGEPIDWYGDFARRCLPVTNYVLPSMGELAMFQVPTDTLAQVSQIDVGYLTILHKEDWLPWDEEFDTVGGWHAVVEWGFRQLVDHNRKLMVLRGLLAWHQPTGFTFNTSKGQWIEQTKQSEAMLTRKLEGRVQDGGGRGGNVIRKGESNVE